MGRQGSDLANDGLRFIENPKLAKHSGAVVIDFLSGEAIFGVEGVNAAKRKLHPTSGGGKTTPGAQMRAADKDLEQNGIVGDVSTLDLDFQVGQRAHDLRVKQADTIGTGEVLIPSFVIVACCTAEGAEDAFKVMCILETDVLLDESDPG
jgi:hypothetical protein